nr:beta-phosphoglucomutase family hydrolase [Agromyces seonyuensis]
MTPIRGYLFDLDGVLTPTAVVHMHAWSRLFNTFLAAYPSEEAYSDADYYAYVDGKPRYDGVRAMLASRGIELPEGTSDDAPETETVRGLGNRKNDEFMSTLNAEGVAPYPASLAFLERVIADGCSVAVVSSSKNAREVLTAAGILDRFEVIVDGKVVEAGHMLGKPAPDTFEFAAKQLGLPPEACAVVEDAESGVTAGATGPFGLVIAVDRGVGRRKLFGLGADVVVDELDELIPALDRAKDASSGEASTDADAPDQQQPADHEEHA